MERLTELEMMEVQAMVAHAVTRFKALEQLASSLNTACRADVRIALADVLTPLNNALEALQ